MLKGAWALISIAEQKGEREREGEGDSVPGPPHWERPGDSQPFEVVICPGPKEGRQIEMSIDNDRQPPLSSDWDTLRSREREGDGGRLRHKQRKWG